MKTNGCKEFLRSSGCLDPSFPFQQSPVQVYPLQLLTKFLVFPRKPGKMNFNFMIHLVEGKMKTRVDSKIHSINGPSIIFVSQGRLSAMVDQSQHITGYFILFENKALNKILASPGLSHLFHLNSLISLGEEENESLSAMNSLLFQEISGSQPNRDVVASFFQGLLYKVLDLAGQENNLNKQQEIAYRFKEQAYQHYASQKKISFYARQLSISENYLNRCVKNILGQSPKEILMEISILQGQLWLKEESKNVAEVAFALGFEDPSYFGRLFKKVTGKTPTQYRLAPTRALLNLKDRSSTVMMAV